MAMKFALGAEIQSPTGLYLQQLVALCDSSKILWKNINIFLEAVGIWTKKQLT